MVFINDMLEGSGKFLSYDRFIGKFGRSISEFNYFSLRDAVPPKWRQLLTQNQLLLFDPKLEPVYLKTNKTSKPVTLTKSKQVYWYLNSINTTKANCIDNWFNKYFIEFTKTQWKFIFNLARMLTHNTKLVEFQFKIIHRAYASDSYDF